MKNTPRLLAILALSVGCASSKYAERCTRLVTLPSVGANPETFLAMAPVDSPCAIVEQYSDEPQFVLWVERNEGNAGSVRAVVRTRGSDGQLRTYTRDIDASDSRMVVLAACTELFSTAESHLDTKCHRNHRMQYFLRRLEEAPDGAGPSFRFGRMYPPETPPLRELENVVHSLAAYVTSSEELTLVRHVHFKAALTALERVLFGPSDDPNAPNAGRRSSLKP